MKKLIGAKKYIEVYVPVDLVDSDPKFQESRDRFTEIIRELVNVVTTTKLETIYRQD